jgi:hypothetical protein
MRIFNIVILLGTTMILTNTWAGRTSSGTIVASSQQVQVQPGPQNPQQGQFNAQRSMVPMSPGGATPGTLTLQQRKALYASQMAQLNRQLGISQSESAQFASEFNKPYTDAVASRNAQVAAQARAASNVQNVVKYNQRVDTAGKALIGVGAAMAAVPVLGAIPGGVLAGIGGIMHKVSQNKKQAITGEKVIKQQAKLAKAQAKLNAAKASAQADGHISWFEKIKLKRMESHVQHESQKVNQAQQQHSQAVAHAQQGKI